MIDRVLQYYDNNAENEWNRLTQGLSAVEFSTTLYLIKKYFPNNGNIIDIGGGPGKYTIYLLQRGFSVTLFDLSNVLLQRAQTESTKLGLSITRIIQGSATDLSCCDNESFNASLMLGPLYHLISKNERLQALSELHRILVKNGIAIVSYLNSWGLMKTGINDFPEWYDIPEKAKEMLHEISLERDVPNFTHCYWSIPSIAINEVKGAGFEILNYAGAESFLSGMKSQLENIKKNSYERYKNVLSLASQLSEEPQYRDTTDHLVIIIRKS